MNALLLTVSLVLNPTALDIIAPDTIVPSPIMPFVATPAVTTPVVTKPAVTAPAVIAPTTIHIEASAHIHDKKNKTCKLIKFLTLIGASSAGAALGSYIYHKMSATITQ